MPKIYYDLSELYLLRRGRLKFYGIARVVAEIGYEMHLLGKDVVFVIYNETTDGFYQIEPVFGRSAPNGLVDLGVAYSAIPFKLRGPKPGRSALRNAWAHGYSSVLRVANHFKTKALKRYLTPIELQGGALFSAGRPKLVADIVNCLKSSGSTTELHALLHDCIPLYDYHPSPDRFQMDFHRDTSAIVEHATHIIANSKFTRIDLLAKSAEKMLPEIRNISVVQLAHECRPDGGSPQIKLPPRPYILGVGITLGRKNLEVILEAQRLMLKQGKTPPLMVIAGANRRRTLTSLMIGKYKDLDPHVLLVNNPEQPDLIALYENALATMMPSKLEGWGLPLGESLWLGTPGVASPLSSLPEVGLDLAIYFDPDSPTELAAVLDRLMTDSAYRDDLRQRIVAARPRLRSWHDVAQDVYNAMSNEPKLELPRSA